MDKKTATHVATEVVVIGSLTVYLLNRIASLEQKISQLELDLQIVAKKEAKVEQVHTAAIRELSVKVLKQPQPHGHSVVRHHPTPSETRVPRTQVSSGQKDPKRVTFSDQDPDPDPANEDDEDDDVLMEREFGSSRRDDHDDQDDQEGSEDRDEEEYVPPQKASRVAISSRSKKPARRGIVSAPARSQDKGRKSNDMEETRAIAERLRREAGAELE